jgi:hypothetical protein
MSEDCKSSANLYNKIFQFTIINSSENHSELMVSANNSLFFNKPSLNCPVSPGSFSLKIDFLDIEKLKEYFYCFSLESYSEKNKYASFLDQYNNRIWVYES